ncbi:MAG: hypothetical protein ACJ779_00105, partial [Chloroflexota bacterium]
MTAGAIAAAIAVIAGFGVAVALVAPVASRRRLGLLHPAVAWLALEAIFFGVGSLAIAIGDAQPGPGLYLGACVVAAAAGVRLAARVGHVAAKALPPDPA